MGAKIRKIPFGCMKGLDRMGEMKRPGPEIFHAKTAFPDSVRAKGGHES